MHASSAPRLLSTGIIVSMPRANTHAMAVVSGRRAGPPRSIGRRQQDDDAEADDARKGDRAPERRVHVGGAFDRFQSSERQDEERCSAAKNDQCSAEDP